MPQFTLPEALRYFFSPFVLFFCWFALDFAAAGKAVKNIGLLGSISFLVAGTTLYFVYRYVIYDAIILPAYDKLRRQNQRIFLRDRFNISSTRDAQKILHQLSETDEYEKYNSKRQRPIRASAVHLLYQAGLCAWPFIVISLSMGDTVRTVGFLAGSGLLLFSAWRIDTDYEDEELIFVRSIEQKVDEAAQALGIQKRQKST